MYFEPLFLELFLLDLAWQFGTPNFNLGGTFGWTYCRAR